jgi:anti-sigma factor RsiW
MSGPAERPTAAATERKLHRLADGALPPDELEVLDELLPADATEAHLRWLESGAEGPEPCDESSG